MKQIVRSGGGGWTIPTEDEVEVVEILLCLRKLCEKSELISPYSFSWGRKRKRSVLDLKSESSPSPSPSPSAPTLPRIDEGTTENLTAAEADKSPSTPLCFSPGGDNRKPPSSVRKTLKRKATDDLMELYNKLQQEKEILMKEVKAIKTLHQELTSENLELKARGQKINYSRNMKNFHRWNSSMKVIDQHCHQQITMFATATPQPPQYCHQQLVVDPNNGKLVAVSCSSNSNGGGRFGLFNQIDSRVKIHGETYDFMASSQPLDQSKYLVMDNDLRVRTATAARKRRMLRMKENKNSTLVMKPSRGCR